MGYEDGQITDSEVEFLEMSCRPQSVYGEGLRTDVQGLLFSKEHKGGHFPELRPDLLLLLLLAVELLYCTWKRLLDKTFCLYQFLSLVPH